MYATGVYTIYEANQVSSRTPLVRSGSNLIGFFIGDRTMKRIDISTPKYPNTFTIVDDIDYDELSGYKWSVRKRGYVFYARRTTSSIGGLKPFWLLMHRVIMNALKGQDVDHRSGDGLDNRRDNLRFCTNSQNQQNRKKIKGSSRFKGVSWSKSSKKWQVHITLNKKVYYLGCRKSEIESALLYDAKARELFGEFAFLNFPDKESELRSEVYGEMILVGVK